MGLQQIQNGYADEDQKTQADKDCGGQEQDLGWHRSPSEGGLRSYGSFLE